MIEAVIFDMDGVLVDSEPVIEAAAMKGLLEYGVRAVPEDFIPFVGAGEDRYIGGVAKKYGVKYVPEMKKRVYEIYLELVNEKLGRFEGVTDVLKRLKDKGIKLALASSADMIKIEANLEVAEIPTDLFEVIIGGEDVINKKPSPDIYLLAAKRLGIDSKHCIVIEDAVNGIEAAIAAQMRCIGISTSFPKDKLKASGADYVCDDIRDTISYLMPSSY